MGVVLDVNPCPVFCEEGKPYMTSDFGWRTNPVTGKKQYHSGIDITRWHGFSDIATICAIQSGVVTEIVRDVEGFSEEQVSGNFITLEHADGYKSRYCHLAYKRIPDWLKIGVQVMKGDILGVMGETGRTTGPHLHFQVKHNDTNIDPKPFILEEEYLKPKVIDMCLIMLPSLKKGDKVDVVKNLQILLNGKGYEGKNGNPLAIDGSFGGQTDYAVRKYQTDFGLKVDGIVGEKTWTSLLS